MLVRQVIVTLLASFLSLSLMGQTFEGVISGEYYSAENDSRMEIEWYLASGNVALKMIMDSEKGRYITTFIARQESQQMDVLSKTPQGTKLHHPIPLKEVKSSENFPAKSSFEVRQQGESKTISGRSCKKIVAESPESKTIAWLAKTINFPFYQYADYFKSDYNLALLSQLSINGFPLQSVTTSNRGLIIESWEAKAIQKKSLSPSVFEVPADYKTVEQGVVKGRE